MSDNEIRAMLIERKKAQRKAESNRSFYELAPFVCGTFLTIFLMGAY